MDAIRSKPAGFSPRRRAGFAVAAVLLALLCWRSAQSLAGLQVARPDLAIGVVVQGDLPLQIHGFGRLISREQRVLTAPMPATVEEILQRPGADVQADQVLLRLTNPDIEQQVSSARIELERQRAQMRELELNQQADELALHAELVQLEAEHKGVDLKREFEAPLAGKGVISRLEYQRTRFEAEQLGQRLELERRRLQHLHNAQAERRRMQQELLQQLEGDHENRLQLRARMEVRAGIDGVLQQLDLEPGQSVASGERLAVVGRSDSLHALLQVAQADAQVVSIGQPVAIDTRGGKAQGRVSRVDPVVRQGSITVEVELLPPLPENARPELAVDGRIEAGVLRGVRYVERPAQAVPFSQTQLFVLDTREDVALPVQVRFGRAVGRFVEVLDGASTGQQLILSDTAAWQNEPRIRIVD